jgi:hypothetical protein
MMKNKTKIFGISILLILGLLIFPNISMACFNPTDSFATEVALNKPSITYDLSGIKQSKDVTVIEKEKEESPDIPEVVYEEVSKPTPITPTEVHTELPLPDRPPEAQEQKKLPDKRIEPSFEDYLETTAIIYRSHYNKDVAVALMEEEWEGQKYLDVKIQVPTKRVHKRMDYVEIDSIADVDVASLDINASEELGWSSRISGGGCYYNEQLDKEICRDSYRLDKGNIHVYLTSEGRVSTEKTEVRITVDNTKTIKTEMYFNEKCRWVSPELKYSCCFECDNAFSKSPIGVGPEAAMCGKFGSGQPLSEKCKTFFENNPMSVSACQKPLELGPCEAVVGYYYDVKYEGCCAVSGCKYVPEIIPFKTQEECQANCKKEVGYQIAEVLVKIGFSKDIEEALQIVKNNAEHKINEWDDLASAIDIDPEGFDWKTALRVELEWLRSNCVISGLTDDDIYGIIKVADKGTAGWNSKIRYFKGEWMQGITEEMSEETGMYMMKGLSGCGGFPIDLLPEEVPSGVEATDEEAAWIRDQIKKWRENPEMQIGGTSIDSSARKTVTLWVYERTPINQQLHHEMVGGWEIIIAESQKPSVFDTFAHPPGLWIPIGCLLVIMVVILVKYRGRRRNRMA